MTSPRRLADLLRLASLERDRALERLRVAAADHASTLSRISEIDAAMAREHRLAAASGDVTLLRLAESHGRWARQRLVDLQDQLARQTVAVTDARSAAARAHGRLDVIARLVRDAERQAMRDRGKARD